MRFSKFLAAYATAATAIKAPYDARDFLEILNEADDSKAATYLVQQYWEEEHYNWASETNSGFRGEEEEHYHKSSMINS